MIMLALPGSILYAIGYVDYPKDKVANRSTDALLDEWRDGSVSNIRGTVKSESKINANGFPGRELVIDAPKDLVFIARMVLAKDRLYQSIVVVPKAHADAPENKKFLDSFKFDKP